MPDLTCPTCPVGMNVQILPAGRRLCRTCGTEWGREATRSTREDAAMTTTTHDLRRSYWGHSVDFLRRQDDGSWTAVIYLSARIKDGDLVLAQGRSGDLTYRVRGEVDRPVDPGDQHFANLVWVPDA